MSLKRCFKCHALKPRTEFYAHPKMGDGLLGKCKTCTKNDVRQYREKNPDTLRRYEKQRFQRPERRASVARTTEAWRHSNPERKRAHVRVKRAVESGRLNRLPCQVCGTNEQVHGHHENYSRPLDVVWLCALHHHRHHAQQRRESR